MPEAVLATPQETGAALAVITPSFERGALLLRNEEGRLYRLSWGEGSKSGSDRRRALPAGKYALAGYRLITTDSTGKTWHVSATAASMREIELASGQETRLAIEPEIKIEKRLRDGQVQVAVQGEGQSGLSIYKEGKRIPLGFELLDRAGKKLAEGKINYG